MLSVFMWMKSFSINSVNTAYSESAVVLSEYPHSQAALAVDAHGQFVICVDNGRAHGHWPNSFISDNVPKRETANNSQGMAPIAE